MYCMGFRSDRMKALRDQLGLSQSELARRAHSTQQTINRLEAGGTDNPRNLLPLARALQTSAAFLMGETDDPTLALGETRLAWGAPLSICLTER